MDLSEALTSECRNNGEDFPDFEGLTPAECRLKECAELNELLGRNHEHQTSRLLPSNKAWSSDTEVSAYPLCYLLVYDGCAF